MVKALDQSQKAGGSQLSSNNMDKQIQVYKQMLFQRDETIRQLESSTKKPLPPQGYDEQLKMELANA